MPLEYEIIIYFVPKLHNENSHITMPLLYKNFGLQSNEIENIHTTNEKYKYIHSFTNEYIDSSMYTILKMNKPVSKKYG